MSREDRKSLLHPASRTSSAVFDWHSTPSHHHQSIATATNPEHKLILYLMSVATARAIHTLLTHSKTNMKLSPHHLLCSSVALWRTASAFAPATSGSSTAAAAAIRTFTSSSALHAASKMDQSFPTWSLISIALPWNGPNWSRRP